MNPIKAGFSTLIATFILIIISFIASNSINRVFFPVAAVLGFAFSILGIVLIILTLKSKLSKKQKTFLVLTGASASGILISAILHNLVSALFNIEEAFFFILAIIVLPIMFLVGVVGSLILFKKK
tara:strand:+ start:305 stop:679 length:375 start_codon:yes stop_codon:yes gene_type:complete